MEVKTDSPISESKVDDAKRTRNGQTYILGDGNGLTCGDVKVLLGESSSSESKTLKAGLDTCSSINLVSFSVLPNFRFKLIDLHDGFSVDSVGGQVSLKRMAEIRLLAQGNVIKANFYIVDAHLLPVSFDLLIGQKTLHDLGYRLVNVDENKDDSVQT